MPEAKKKKGKEGQGREDLKWENVGSIGACLRRRWLRRNMLLILKEGKSGNGSFVSGDKEFVKKYMLTFKMNVAESM